jgi:hypothetical protein
MAAKLIRLTHKIAIQLHLVAESCTICSSWSRRPVRKLLDTPSCSQPKRKKRVKRQVTLCSKGTELVYSCATIEWNLYHHKKMQTDKCLAEIQLEVQKYYTHSVRFLQSCLLTPSSMEQDHS